ncbi:SH3 domain-binding protein 5-like [Halotydeus destructor]|nr:SH3 domain-binding protein 5-like [Halotydeus destructor]
MSSTCTKDGAANSNINRENSSQYSLYSNCPDVVHSTCSKSSSNGNCPAKCSSKDEINSDINDEPIDPRIQVELETLNTLTDLINKLELELDDSRTSFRQLLTGSTKKINLLSKRLGSCVEKAKPYYEARIRSKILQDATQKAAVRYERASSSHIAAKEMVLLSEEGLMIEGRIFDPAWQEMLNHATKKVNDAERERSLSEREHGQLSHDYNEAERLVASIYDSNKRSISKARPYFEAKAQFNQLMDEQVKEIKMMEVGVAAAKRDYASALKRLEVISGEIHAKRNQRRQDILNIGQRGQGVGAESPAVSLSPRLSETLRKLTISEKSSGVIKSPLEDKRIDNPWIYPSGSYASSVAGSERDDCDSIASGDTIDTLDDATIEKLMIDSDLQSITSPQD